MVMDGWWKTAMLNRGRPKLSAGCIQSAGDGSLSAGITAIPTCDSPTALPKPFPQFHVQVLNLGLAEGQILVNGLVNRQLSGTHPWQKRDCKKGEMRACC